MNTTRIELRRTLAKLNSARKIGNTDHPELMNIPGNKKLFVYADTETYYDTNGVEPGSHLGQKQVGQVLAEMDVYPFIVCGQFRRHKKSPKGNIYESGGVYDRCIYLDDPGRVEALLHDLSMIFNNWGFTPVLAFHNTSYDMAVLEPIFKSLDPDMIIYFYTDDSKHFIRGSMQSQKYNFFCELYDTLKYDKSMSIEKAGEILGLPKLKGLPYGLCDIELTDNDQILYRDFYTGKELTYPLEEYMEYASRDVDIARRIHERRIRQSNLVNEIMVEDGTKMKQFEFNRRCSTRASHSKNICNRYLEMKGGEKIDTVFRFQVTEQLHPNPKELYKQTIESNCGGFTCPNKDIFKYDCGEDRIIRYFDRNSMYPTIMTGGLPYGQLLREHRKPDNATTGYVIKLKGCKWKGNMTCLKTQPFGITKVNKRRTFFVEKEYFDFVLENADVDYELVDTWYQENTKIIKPLIDMYYNKRKECKTEMKELKKRGEDNTGKYADLQDQQEGLKILMNALYGKMCEGGHHTGIVYYESKYTKFKHDELSYPCILTGSFITYRGRLSLLQKIKAILDAGHDFLYADTDSVILGCPKDVDMTKIFGVDNGNLGEGKEEGQYDLYLSLGIKKKYALINRRDRSYEPKMAFSGVVMKVQDVLLHQLKNVNFERTVDDLIFLFDKKNNVLIERCKRINLPNHSYNQPIMYFTNFQLNRKAGEPNATLKIIGDDYILDRHG